MWLSIGSKIHGIESHTKSHTTYSFLDIYQENLLSHDITLYLLAWLIKYATLQHRGTINIIQQFPTKVCRGKHMTKFGLVMNEPAYNQKFVFMWQFSEQNQT